jgi:formamidopyrimidine-DNA glycosylase
MLSLHEDPVAAGRHYPDDVPELPEVESTRRRIARSLVRARIEAVELRRPDLRRPFPRRFVQRATGQTITALTRRAKYLLAPLSSGETLLMHLGMSGAFRVVRGPDAALDAHDHVVFHLSSGRAVVFNDPRRFGMIDLVPAGRLGRHPVLSRLGPEPLSDAFDGAALARSCRGKRTSLKAALLDQRVVAGLGNIYASEALHAARLSPRRAAAVLSTSRGTPTEAAHRLAAAVKTILNAAIARQSQGLYRGARFAVYDRQGERCTRPGCAGTIRGIVQAGRTTYFCPVCQR